MTLLSLQSVVSAVTRLSQKRVLFFYFCIILYYFVLQYQIQYQSYGKAHALCISQPPPHQSAVTRLSQKSPIFVLFCIILYYQISELKRTRFAMSLPPQCRFGFF
jgi:hypothetical protein